MENTSRTSARVQVVVVVVVVSQSEGSAGRRGAQGSAETLTRRLPNAPNAGWSAAVLDRDESLYRLQLHKSCEDFYFFFTCSPKKKFNKRAPSQNNSGPNQRRAGAGQRVAFVFEWRRQRPQQLHQATTIKQTNKTKQKRCLVTGWKTTSCLCLFLSWWPHSSGR